jgi:hypothetical protein
MFARNAIMRTLFVGFSLLVLGNCTKVYEETRYLEHFRDYYSASKSGSLNKWNFTTDTVKVWFDKKSGDPSLQIKGKQKTGKWSEWDKEMNSSSNYDSIWFDDHENAVKGYFFENNDFYELIGKEPTKTERTFWFDQNRKIKEILIYWIPEENTTTAEHLKPIVEWAMENDSLEIQQLYPDGNFIPSAQNAIRWKDLLKSYRDSKNSDQ